MICTRHIFHHENACEAIANLINLKKKYRIDGAHTIYNLINTLQKNAALRFDCLFSRAAATISESNDFLHCE